MSNFVKIQHPTKGGIDFEPFEFQERLIEVYSKYRYSINMLPRQTGKQHAFLTYFGMLCLYQTVQYL